MNRLGELTAELGFIPADAVAIGGSPYGRRLVLSRIPAWRLGIRGQRDDPEAEELALIYRAKGLDAEDAERVATTIMKGRQAALHTMAREELGLDPDQLGSPGSAALSSLGAFAAGAVVVVLPYLFSSGWAALIAAIILASLALFTVGAVIGVHNGRGRSGMRQLLIGGGAAMLVYLIGRGVGALTAVQLGGA